MRAKLIVGKQITWKAYCTLTDSFSFLTPDGACNSYLEKQSIFGENVP